MCGAAPDESIASYSLRSVPPGSILLLLYAMNEVVMKLAGLNMLLNLRDPPFEISEPEGRVGDYAQVHYFRVAEDPFNTDLDARMCPPISGGRTGIDADLCAGRHSAEQRAKAFSHGSVREDGVAQRGVRQRSSHR